MNALSRFVELAKGEPRADYAVVYLEEAHPTNGWMYPAVEHHIVQHTVVAERVAAAQILRRELDKLRADLQNRHTHGPLEGRPELHTPTQVSSNGLLLVDGLRGGGR